MALLKRTKKEDTTLPEVDKYYEAERRDRSGMAWLLAAASILVVALIIVGLFLAGRWAYDKITDDNNDVATETSEETEDLPSIDGESTEENNDSEDQAPTNDDDTDDNSSDSDGDTPSDNNSDNTDEEVDGNNDSSNDETPATGDNSGKETDLPNTGPADTLAIFAVSTTAGTVVHYAIERRKNVK